MVRRLPPPIRGDAGAGLRALRSGGQLVTRRVGSRGHSLRFRLLPPPPVKVGIHATEGGWEARCEGQECGWTSSPLESRGNAAKSRAAHIRTCHGLGVSEEA
jgi:hypothetical protein